MNQSGFSKTLWVAVALAILAVIAGAFFVVRSMNGSNTTEIQQACAHAKKAPTSPEEDTSANDALCKTP